jgi:hypothetical protein
MIGSNILPLLEQLEIDKDFIAIGKPTMDCTISRQKGPNETEYLTNVSFRPHIGL